MDVFRELEVICAVALGTVFSSDNKTSAEGGDFEDKMSDIRRIELKKTVNANSLSDFTHCAESPPDI